MNNILPIGTPIVNKVYNMENNNLTPNELCKMFCKASPSFILTRISSIKDYIRNEIIKKKNMNNSIIDHDLINNDIDSKINCALENIKYEIFAGSFTQLSEMTINFLRLVFYNSIK
jgi:hypothetical protein